MFIKWLCLGGHNEPILLQLSSLPILGGDYLFIGETENSDLSYYCIGFGVRKESVGLTQEGPELCL